MSRFPQGPAAKVAELVDALDLGSSGVTREGSSPSFRTILDTVDRTPVTTTVYREKGVTFPRYRNASTKLSFRGPSMARGFDAEPRPTVDGSAYVS